MFFLNVMNSWFSSAGFFRLEHPVFLLLMLVLLLVLFVFFVRFFAQKKSLRKAVSDEHAGKLFPQSIKNRKLFRFVLWIFAMLLLVVGITNPQFGSKKEEVLQKGVDLVFAIDVSKSMLAEDIAPNRLARAKHAISKVIDGLGADRVAIVVFAGDAFLQLPLTSDHGAAKMYLNEIDVDLIPAGGTSLSAAMRKSLSALPDKKEGAAIVLITDGEDQEDQAVDVAVECADQGVKVYTLGLGTVKGSTIPVFANGKKVGFKKDKNGSTVVSKINESLLMDVAENSGGTYSRASNQELGLRILFDEIKGMDQTEYGQKKFTSYEHRFMYFIFAALMLLVVEFLLFSNKWKKG